MHSHIPHASRLSAIGLCLAFAGSSASNLLAQGPAAAPPPEPATWIDALKQGRHWLSFRLRYENVDQDGFSKEANALTLRTVLGYESAPWKGFTGLIEFEDVAPIGDDDFNSTTNGHTSYPTVADPEGAEINQALLRYAGSKSWSASAGRQRITLDNQRFVGNVGWRQNEQTYDAVSAKADLPGEIALFAAYVDNVNRVFGDASPVGDYRMHSELLNASREFGPVGKLSLYGYWLDNLSAPTTSSDTYGARLAGKRPSESAVGLQWALEYATQSDAADNPLDIDQDYQLIELGATVRGVTLLAGSETLGGSGKPGDAFQTPLATLHAFNGWADKFLTTPDNGLEDFYVSLGATCSKVKGDVVWHEFDADSGGADYGSELDLMVSYPFSKSCSVGVKYADYDADAFATDTTKFWLWFSGSI